MLIFNRQWIIVKRSFHIHILSNKYIIHHALQDSGKIRTKEFVKQVIDEYVEETDSHSVSNERLVSAFFSRQHCTNEGFFETHRKRTEQKPSLIDLNNMLSKFALEYRFMIMSTTQWKKYLYFIVLQYTAQYLYIYSNKNKTPSSIRTICNHCPTNIWRFAIQMAVIEKERCI